MEKHFDVLIIGAGPSGIFTALELIRTKKANRIVMIEQGRPIETRACPKAKLGKCVQCKPFCNITTGFSGAGAFSDGKLSLSYEVGGDLPELIGISETETAIKYTDSIYLEFGADEKVEGLNVGDKVKSIRKKAISAGLKLVDCPIRHLGTEKAHEIYTRLQKYLLDNGVEIKFNTSCLDIIIEDGICTGAVMCDNASNVKTTYLADRIVVATGRKGADWLENICRTYDIKRKAGVVDIGVRVECRNEIMEEVNNVLYESKLIGYVEPFNDKVRTFCQNPGGFVSQENYDNNLATVNGHSYKDRKSEN
ncbi:MAG: FAD-binding protein, partial [Clostridia bacterium]